MGDWHQDVKLFVGGLSWNIDDNSLWEAFSKHGEVPFCRVATEKETGKSRGFGFVSFKDAEAAETAIKEMYETELDGRSAQSGGLVRLQP